jgi:hypothetical protein
LSELKNKITQLKGRVEQMEKEMNKENETFNNKIYPNSKKISKITEALFPLRWDIDSKNVRGCKFFYFIQNFLDVLKDGNATVFNISQSKSDFEICNGIWDVLK